MKRVLLNEYLALRKGAEVLEQDAFGDKVLRLADGSMLKLFRRKRLISSAALYPYAQRFVDNAAALARLGIAAPTVTDLFRVPECKRDVVRYVPVPGETLRQLHREGQLTPEQISDLKCQLAEFVVKLHDLGIYFRSLHLGNVVRMPDGDLALIDVADMKIHRRPLNGWLRKRNLVRMLAISEVSERPWFDGGETAVR